MSMRCELTGQVAEGMKWCCHSRHSNWQQMDQTMLCPNAEDFDTSGKITSVDCTLQD